MVGLLMFFVARFFSGCPPLTGILLISLGYSSTCAAQQLTLVTVENSADTAVSEAVLREAYGRLNVNLIIKKYPAEPRDPPSKPRPGRRRGSTGRCH